MKLNDKEAAKKFADEHELTTNGGVSHALQIEAFLAGVKYARESASVGFKEYDFSITAEEIAQLKAMKEGERVSFAMKQAWQTATIAAEARHLKEMEDATKAFLNSNAERLKENNALQQEIEKLKSELTVARTEWQAWKKAYGDLGRLVAETMEVK